jgi:dienelactone hydrolase
VRRLLAALLVACAVNAAAQDDAARHARAAMIAPDLAFPADVSNLGFFSTPRMALYKPEGEGPFPALVLVHQCGGLGEGARANVSMLDWVKRAVARGYVTLLIDSLDPRGARQVCFGPQQNVFPARGARDVLQAAAHLRALPYVDGRRVAVAGYSWGAMVGMFASSRSIAEAMLPGERPAAVVSFYPGCFTIKPSTGAPYELARPDIDRPLLVLMGEEDNETPPQDCVDKLSPLRGAGKPVELHVYPKATHCWDCRQLDGFRKKDFRGTDVVYRYDPSVTEDSARRMFEFLDRHLQRR